MSVKSPRDFKGQKDYKTIVLSKELAIDLLRNLNTELNKPEYKEFKDEGDFEGLIKQIQAAVPRLDQITPASISMNEILSDLNDDEDKTKSSLYIITAHNPDELRHFTAQLGERLYETRRKSGVVRPLTSFIFDEADNALDENNQKKFRQKIEKISKKKLVILISH